MKNENDFVAGKGPVVPGRQRSMSRLPAELMILDGSVSDFTDMHEQKIIVAYDGVLAAD